MPLHRSRLRRSVFRIFEPIEEHWLTEDGHPVAPELFRVDNPLAAFATEDGRHQRLPRKTAASSVCHVAFGVVMG